MIKLIVITLLIASILLLIWFIICYRLSKKEKQRKETTNQPLVTDFESKSRHQITDTAYKRINDIIIYCDHQKIALPNEISDYLLPVLDNLHNTFNKINMSDELKATSLKTLQVVEKALDSIYVNLQQGKVLDFKAEMQVIKHYINQEELL